jgi:hypothetical protein
MLQLSEAQILEIADNLDSGFDCFIQPDTGEMACWPNFDNGNFDIEEYCDGIGGEEGEAELARYEEAVECWVFIKGMESRDAFRVMEDFVEQVSSGNVRERLIQALDGQKPFANFRRVLDYHDEWLKKWYKFKAAAFIPWVEQQIAAHNAKDDDEEE